MQVFSDAPQILREFLSYHETIKGQSKKTISEYYLDIRMFLRFMRMVKDEMPYHTDLDTISIREINLDFIKTITITDIFDYLSYLANDRISDTGHGIGPAARARKLSAIKSFYKYLTVRTKQLSGNPVKDIEFPKIRKSLPKYLTLDEAKRLLATVRGKNEKRDYAILMLFLNCGIRRSELVSLNISDIYDDRVRVSGKGNKERIVYYGSACKAAIDAYMPIRKKMVLTDDKALFASQKLNRISVTAVHRLVEKHMLAAGLDASQYSAHKLRHTAATLMVGNGVDIKTVQEVLGHEHLNTTEIYTHIENTELKIAAEANPLSHLEKGVIDESDF